MEEAVLWMLGVFQLFPQSGQKQSPQGVGVLFLRNVTIERGVAKVSGFFQGREEPFQCRNAFFWIL